MACRSRNGIALGHKRRHHPRRQLRIGQAAQGPQLGGRETRPGRRHIQPAILRQPGQQHPGKIQLRRLASRRYVTHENPILCRAVTARVLAAMHPVVFCPRPWRSDASGFGSDSFLRAPAARHPCLDRVQQRGPGPAIISCEGNAFAQPQAHQQRLPRPVLAGRSPPQPSRQCLLLPPDPPRFPARDAGRSRIIRRPASAAHAPPGRCRRNPGSANRPDYAGSRRPVAHSWKSHTAPDRAAQPSSAVASIQRRRQILIRQPERAAAIKRGEFRPLLDGQLVER